MLVCAGHSSSPGAHIFLRPVRSTGECVTHLFLISLNLYSYLTLHSGDDSGADNDSGADDDPEGSADDDSCAVSSDDAAASDRTEAKSGLFLTEFLSSGFRNKDENKFESEIFVVDY